MTFYESMWNVYGDRADVYETESGKAKIIINSEGEQTTTLQYFDNGEDAVEFLYRRGWIF